MNDAPDFTRLPDLASRRLGAGVVAASDELFAEKENLIKADAPTYASFTFGNKGQVYDGWETRRRREPGIDWAVIRLGSPGIVHGVLVDTSFFTGNYPPQVSLQGAYIDGYPAPDELSDADWFELVGVQPVQGDSVNPFTVSQRRLVSHVRLRMHPDGGIARLRVHGEVVPDPRLVAQGQVDLVAVELGGKVTDCSNMFYSAPANLILPGEARSMGEGWETSRRRDDGHDWVQFALAGPGAVRIVELDTRHFVGNAPGWARLTGTSVDGQQVEILPRTRLQPDTRHRFRVSAIDGMNGLDGLEGQNSPDIVAARLEVFPDGGMARVRLWGPLTDRGRSDIGARWRNAGGVMAQ
ncbi:allantoicase [Allobranchiibius sp. GilTou73]|uniref:allantoicase n=1 Tax=Allobranchiibius sp. GilTou73 TaxID=2904523 RepID=UPI001F3A4481|nr:allantoicase [Allobranchiibius sp. GilTou73]UIJ35667.1 allantoicase [Allobranchiibius sp. GilTou73]